MYKFFGSLIPLFFNDKPLVFYTVRSRYSLMSDIVTLVDHIKI